MRIFRLPGLIAYVAMAMWLLQLAVSPLRAEESGATPSRLGDHVEEIRAALIAHGARDTIKVTLAAPDAAISIDAEDELKIGSVSRNPATGRFLVRAQGAPGTPPLAIAGTAASAVLVPVPARMIERNETIVEADIDWVEIADARASAYVEDADAIIGKIARRPLAAGVPFRKVDVTAPILIKRGATATIVLEAPGIRLTQNAVALENGTAGDLIAFRNVSSDREIEAVVAGVNLARAPFAARSVVASNELDR